jgi:hypothetical protein
VVKAGDQVETGDLSEEWPAFRWCVNRDRTGGWVPDRFLEPGSEGEATARRDYDTTELAAEAGEIVTVIEVDEESGWLWCSSASGRAGWVPVSSVEPLG